MIVAINLFMYFPNFKDILYFDNALYKKEIMTWLHDLEIYINDIIEEKICRWIREKFL